METASSYGQPVQGATIHVLFEQVAHVHPERTAVRAAGRAVSYAELAAAARCVAAELSARGIGPGDIVPVISRRSVDLPAALLGILATGAAYGMLDVRWPPSRLHRFMNHMGASLAVADEAGLTALADAQVSAIAMETLLGSTAKTRALAAVSPQACATVFWTSGSTGEPKAVLSPHQATTRLFVGSGYLDYGPEPVMINAAAVAWDAFTLEMWGMLLLGGTVLVHPDDVLLPSSLRSYIRDYGVTHLFLTPALAEVVVAGDIDCLAGLRCLLMGGDKPRLETCQKLFAAYPNIELINGYGPVESCVFASVHQITPAEAHAERPVPAGRAVPGTGVHIVAGGRVLPRGQRGEIALSGTGLGLGYLNAPELTAAAFRSLTIDGETRRTYLTGDHGHIDEHGVLHFSGRKDAQIKIAGHRIEPAEVEATALSVGCGRAVAMPLPDTMGNPRLILFAEPAEPGQHEQDLHSRLREFLPAYMLPTRVHIVPTMPLLENTKINKRELVKRFGYHD